MTNQITDTVVYEGDDYSVIETDRYQLAGGGLATPAQFGMSATKMHTACHRGHFSVYELTEGALYLREMTLLARDGNYLPIAGVMPAVDEDLCATYLGLRISIPASGKFRLARDFDSERYLRLYNQSGREPQASGFNVVLDIVLKDGALTGVVDRSGEAWQGLDHLNTAPRSTKLRNYLDNL